MAQYGFKDLQFSLYSHLTVMFALELQQVKLIKQQVSTFTFLIILFLLNKLFKI